MTNGTFSSGLPQDEGFCPKRLDLLERRYQKGVVEGEIPGAVIMIARHGKLIFIRALGYANRDSRQAMTEDARFALASMTKPITTVAAMTLVEEGELTLDAPIDRYLPEFANVRIIDESGDLGGKALIPTCVGCDSGDSQRARILIHHGKQGGLPWRQR
jgi:CubicO group peptidase (beta-lactamase class C family)